MTGAEALPKASRQPKMLQQAALSTGDVGTAKNFDQSLAFCKPAGMLEFLKCTPTGPQREDLITGED